MDGSLVDTIQTVPPLPQQSSLPGSHTTNIGTGFSKNHLMCTEAYVAKVLKACVSFSDAESKPSNRPRIHVAKLQRGILGGAFLPIRFRFDITQGSQNRPLLKIKWVLILFVLGGEELMRI